MSSCTHAVPSNIIESDFRELPRDDYRKNDMGGKSEISYLGGTNYCTSRVRMPVDSIDNRGFTLKINNVEINRDSFSKNKYKI